jgi:hypothetical protein
VKILLLHYTYKTKDINEGTSKCIMYIAILWIILSKPLALSMIGGFQVRDFMQQAPLHGGV